MNDRELISFKVDEAALDYQRDTVIPFWKERSMRTRLLGAMTDEWKEAYAAGIFTEFMEQRGPGHTVGSNKIYEKGFLDYQADIDAALAALDYMNDPTASQRAEELRAMRIACDAIMVMGSRYAELADEMARQTADPARRKELEQIAENCRVVPAHKPRTFWQAIQMYWFVHLCVTTELNPWDAYSPGRFDQHLNPFYKADTEAGILDDAHALELLECLWVKFNDQPAPPKVGVTLKESGTYTDFANNQHRRHNARWRGRRQSGQLPDTGLHGRDEAASAVVERADQPQDAAAVPQARVRDLAQGLGPARVLQHRVDHLGADERRQEPGGRAQGAAPADASRPAHSVTRRTY